MVAYPKTTSLGWSVWHARSLVQFLSVPKADLLTAFSSEYEYQVILYMTCSLTQLNLVNLKRLPCPYHYDV